jgi:hypothetical protein
VPLDGTDSVYLQPREESVESLGVGWFIPGLA